MQYTKSVLKKGFDFNGNCLYDNNEFIDLLGKMLDFNPNRRISPSEVLKHKFL